MPQLISHSLRAHGAWLAVACACVAMLATALLTAPASAQGAAPAPHKGGKIWDGAYTQAQAARGKTVFLSRCAFCHLEDLSGGDGPALVGGNFGRNWGSRYLDRLFKKIKEKMPPGEEFLVTDAEKLDIVAFILQSNGFPAGNEELRLDPAYLATIQIVGKNGPEPAPTGAMVEVIGCLVDEGKEWKMTNATEPVVSTMDDPAGDAAAATGRAMGTDTVRLLDVFPKPDAHKGHKMMAKGLLIRSPNDTHVNVLTLDMVAPTCP